MTIDPISLGIGSPLPSINPLGSGAGLAPAEKTTLGGLADTMGIAGSGASGAHFGNVLSNQLQNLQQAQGAADTAAVQAATGDLTDVHEYMIKSNEAQIMTDLTVAVRNKAVEAFQEILRMQA